MNLEPSSTQTDGHLINELPAVGTPDRAVLAGDHSRLHSAQPHPAIDEAALSKASTLLIDASADDMEDVPYKTPSKTSRNYVQGVVQGQQIYLITNLLQGESQTLLQPQMVWTIGRNREAALPLQDRALSRRHAVILYVQPSGFQLIDLNSMNGSFINGMRIQHRSLLKDGDLIRLGNTDFTFFLSGRSRSVDAIHPEVLARFTASKSRSEHFMDYSALEEPEILFKTVRK